MAMYEFLNELFTLIEKYKDLHGMSYAEAVGFLNLASDELSEACRAKWVDDEMGKQGDNEPKEPWQS